MSNGEKWIELKRGGDVVCPMCGKQDWCSVSPDGICFDCKRGKGQPIPAGFEYVKDSAQGVIVKLIDQSLVGCSNCGRDPEGTSRQAYYRPVQGSSRTIPEGTWATEQIPLQKIWEFLGIH
jgi:hypothetical protein